MVVVMSGAPQAARRQTKDTDAAVPKMLAVVPIAGEGFGCTATADDIAIGTRLLADLPLVELDPYRPPPVAGRAHVAFSALEETLS